MQIRFYLLLAAATSSFAALVPSSEEKPLQSTGAHANTRGRYKAYVQVQNQLPAKVSFELDHLRGLDFFGTNETKDWYNIGPGEYSDKWKISYEKAREHFDYWQIILNFTNEHSKWSMASKRIFNPLGIEDNGTTLEFDIHDNIFRTMVNSRINAIAEAPIDVTLESPEQPANSPTRIDSFFFLKINNTLNTLEYVEAKLNSDHVSDYLHQTQLFKHVPPGVLPNTHALPFFFEKDDTKDFNENWFFTIRPKKYGRAVSYRNTCRLAAWAAGKVLTLNVAEEGWSIADTECKGPWYLVRESKAGADMLQPEL